MKYMYGIGDGMQYENTTIEMLDVDNGVKFCSKHKFYKAENSLFYKKQADFFKTSRKIFPDAFIQLGPGRKTFLPLKQNVYRSEFFLESI